MVKRGVDIAFSAFLLCLALPALLLSMLVIRLTSKGPVLFRQTRMGRNFHPFEILKLRTMAHAQPGLAYTFGPDARITPFGRWLRRTKLDEVPQLWNVLRGDMSLVGPRPVLPELTEEFAADYALLLRVRPGLTDPASLKYSQEARLLGTVKDPMDFFKGVVTPDKIQISLQYLATATSWSDLATIGMTALVCCFPVLSKLYGEMPGSALARPDTAPATVPAVEAIPALAGIPATVRPRPASFVQSATDDCAFSMRMTWIEAKVEEVLDRYDPQWSPVQLAESAMRSPPSAQRSMVSRI